MCGIVGIYLKNKKHQKNLGKLLTGMMNNMASRGPDSAGFAIYDKSNKYKYSVCLNVDLQNQNLSKLLKNKLSAMKFKKVSDHVVIETTTKPEKAIGVLKDIKGLDIVGYGKSIEIFKQVGNPKDVVKQFSLDKFTGSHAIGHTRMATESAITTDGSHPYSTGEDECLVHNGSLSNHNNLRRSLVKNGVEFKSLNDTEVAAGYISNSLKNKNSLKDTLTSGLKDLDGFYTFITGTRNGFAVLRDEIACKPAVIAENSDYVAIASEFQAMAHLPNVNKADIYEPKPGVVYSWGS
ncbi:glutamine amidotransferase family protein [Alphaproteobacteria bacterium]|nr:glutamine amidotransferase family protein [Alphaproteobacteria bacterium]